MHRRIPMILVAENIRSLENIGSLFRVADGVGALEIVCVGISGYPDMGLEDTRRPYLRQKIHEKIKRSAIKSIDSVAFRYFATTYDCIGYLRSIHSMIVSIEQSEKSLLYTSEFEIREPMALIFGNELDGVSAEFMEASDEVLEIPQYGESKSLNVSVSAGIVCYELMHRLRAVL